MTENGNKSNIWLWIIGVVVATGALFWAASMIFPQIISQLTTFLVGLFVVATGMFLRRKK